MRYRIMRHPEYTSFYWVEKKFFFVWMRVSSTSLYIKEAEHFISAKLHPVIAEYSK
jgi:hypothetical protein